VRGLRVVAEGIETADQLAALRALGCDRGQGYHFARPLEPADPKLTAALGLPGVARAVA
jgi:EAL domain-containing protein (putative c-di-GMP-specific phosphodiesterase class I)